MTLFWAASAVLAVAALALVLWPLLARRGRSAASRSALNISVYRDQLRELDADLGAGTLAPADHDLARRELEARLLEDASDPGAAPARRGGRGLAAVLAAAVPLCALALYFIVGSPGAIDPQRAGRHGVAAPQVEAMVERLAARLRENPEDVVGWKLLGRSYSVLGRFADAADAYGRAAARAPRDAQLLADFADALAMAHGRRLEGEPAKLIARALEIDPHQLKALALAGTIAFERKDYAAAAGYWQRMLPLVPADSEDARTIRENVAEARALSGKAGSTK